ncbi:ROK family transcriptional regulator [Aliiroseovarius sp. 2305UL8-7]|uniref:ROK family transcriptional regulator n=1 Tax=Aliiroseovarius conchicola TaxID=3121637 RepID=UPI003526CC18
MATGKSIHGNGTARARTSNRQAVLGRIQSAGQMGRAEIARALGLSTQAVSNIIAELEDDGLLFEVGTRSAGRGLPAVQYGVNAQGGYALGIEIRPDAVFAALVDLQGQPAATRRHALKNTKPEKLVSKVVKLRDDMLSTAGIDLGKLLGAGVVIPGPFGHTGLSGLGSDLDGWQDFDAQVLFEDALGVPVEFSNDANAAAMSERIARGLSNFAYLYFGAGLGLGLIHHGQLITGAYGNAGEIGHVQINTPNGPASLERQLSRVALQTHMGAETILDVKAIDRLFASSDSVLMEWLENGAAALSQAVGLIENMFDPQTVVLGGAMPETVLDHLVRQTTLPALSVSNRADNTLPRLQRGTCGPMTATKGAASLILNRAFTPQLAIL